MNGQPPQFHSLVIKTTIKGISRSLWGWNAWKFRRCATLQRHVTRYRQGEPFHCVRWLMTKFLNNFQISRSQDVVNSENRLQIQLKLMGLKTSQSRDQSACPMNETISKICRWEWGHVTVTRDPIRWRCFPFQAESIQSDSFVFFVSKWRFTWPWTVRYNWKRLTCIHWGGGPSRGLMWPDSLRDASILPWQRPWPAVQLPSCPVNHAPTCRRPI